MAETVSALLRELRAQIAAWREESGLPFVWNQELDPVAEGRVPCTARVIIVGDNPGNKEFERSIYLIGPTGTMVRNAINRWVGSPFGEVALVLNKTPLHTPGTADLEAFKAQHAALLAETQRYMADMITRVHAAMPEATVWIMGFGGCYAKGKGWLMNRTGSRGQTPTFYDALQAFYVAHPDLAARLAISQHFSHGAFTRDLAARGIDVTATGFLPALAQLPYKDELLRYPLLEQRAR